MKTIKIDIMNESCSIEDLGAAVGDSGSVLVVAENVPHEWHKEGVYVYALFRRDDYAKLCLTENFEAIVPTEVLMENKSFKVCIYASDSMNDSEYSYRYAAAPVWVNVGDGLELDASVLPDKNGMDAVSALLGAMEAANEAEKKRAEFFGIWSENTKQIEQKLSGIESGAEVNVQSDWEESDETKDSFIKNKPQIDQSFMPESANAQSGKAVAEALAQLVNGSPEALDTLNELAKALGDDPNFAATTAEEIGKKANDADLHAIAKSGDYNDLSNKPIIDTAMDAQSSNAVSNGTITAYLDNIMGRLITGDITIKQAKCDMNGKRIDTTYLSKIDASTTYSTKEEVGNIETALDGIIAIQNTLLGVSE